MSEPLVLERETTASPDAVYHYLVNSAAWTTWQGAQAELVPEPGGIFQMTMADGRTARGQYMELRPAERVVFTWGWVDMPGLPPGSTTVTVDLIPKDGGTLIRLTHDGLSPEESALHRSGWSHYLPRLATAATGADPGFDEGPEPLPPAGNLI